MAILRKIKVGLMFGFIAGVIDVIPMIFQKLTWDANISAFLLWIVAGVMISTSKIGLYSTSKGIFISYLILLPSAVLVGWKQPFTLIPIFIMTFILGSLLGYFIDHYKGKL